MSVREVFGITNCRQYGMQARDVQVRVADCVEQVLSAPMLPAKLIELEKDGKKEQHALHRSIAGLIEAGTGTGKTLAYLAPLLQYIAKHKKRVAISTYTRALQRQILTGGDLEMAMRLTGINVTYGVRIGMGNFVSRARVEILDKKMREGGDLDDADIRDQWDRFVSWVRSWGKDIDPLETTVLAWRDTYGDMPSRMGRPIEEGEVMLRNADDVEDAMHYLRHAKAAKDCDIVITNHASLLLRAWGVDVIGTVGALVVDEADRLADAAKSMLSKRLRPHLLVEDARKRGVEIDEETARAGRQLSALMIDIGREFSWRDIALPDLLSLVDHVEEVLALLDAMRIPQSTEEGRALASIRKLLRGEKGYEGDGVMTMSFSPVRHLPAFAFEPFDVADFVGKLFNAWDDERPIANHVVLTSASLSNPASRKPMEHIHQDFGLGRDVVVLREKLEPASFGRMSFVLPDPRTKEPFQRVEEELYDRVEFSAQWLDYVAQAIATEPMRRKLVLSPSFTEVGTLLERRGRAQGTTTLEDDVLYHQPDQPAHMLLRALQDPKLRAIVTPSWWEGVNLVIGGALWMQDLLITRIPIPPYSDVLEAAQIDHLLRNSGVRDRDQARRIVTTQRAAAPMRKLLQGIGRGTRNPHDDVRVWLLDPRVDCASEWAYDIVLALEEAGRSEDADAISLAVDNQPSRHIALKRWRNAIPSRFMPATQDAAMFLQTGELQCKTPSFV